MSGADAIWDCHLFVERSGVGDCLASYAFLQGHELRRPRLCCSVDAEHAESSEDHEHEDALEFSCGGVQRLGGVRGGRSASCVLEHVGSRHRVPSLLANMNSELWTLPDDGQDRWIVASRLTTILLTTIHPALLSTIGSNEELVESLYTAQCRG